MFYLIIERKIYIKTYDKNLYKNISYIINNINARNPVKLKDDTPLILVQNGIRNLPIYENPSHIRKNILTKNEAKKLGLSVSNNDHYHGLGINTYIKVIKSLDNPRAIYKYKNKNEYLILTLIKDKKNNNIIIPIEVETNTNVNNINIRINRIKTVYGYEINNPNLNMYIKYNIRNNIFEKIYEKKERGTGNCTVASSLYK